jgi:hypothetical protein
MHDSVASAQKGDPTFVIHMAFRQALGIFQHQGKNPFQWTTMIQFWKNKEIFILPIYINLYTPSSHLSSQALKKFGIYWQN